MMPQSEEEMEAIRNAVVQREGLLMSVFDILRRVPRRLLMLLKLNDLVRYVCRYISDKLIDNTYELFAGAWIDHWQRHILA